MNSNAKKGVCTGTAGYIADAEIAEIIAGTGSKRSGRVIASFVDASSNSDILVYDNNQWVGYMSAATKETRSSLYAAWGLGGPTDWASDLQKYNPVPSPSKDWKTFKLAIRSNLDPKSDDGVRGGNWTKLTCTNDFTRHPLEHAPQESWKELGADSAWEDAIRNWKENNRDRQGYSFMDSVGDTFGMGRAANTQCNQLSVGDNCDDFSDCPNSANGDSSGPAAQLICNSLVRIHLVYHEYYNALSTASGVISMSLGSMTKTFAGVPPPPDNSMTELLIDFFTLGALSFSGPFFNTFLKTTAYFAAKQGSSAHDNIKDTVMTLIGQGTSIGKGLLPDKGGAPWTDKDQSDFSHYKGKAITAWRDAIALSVKKLFKGEDEELETMWELMSDGKLIRGLGEAHFDVNKTSTNMEHDVSKSFYAFAIPNLWRYSKTYAFVIDSGISCGTANPLGDYLTDDTMKSTGSCVDDRWYFLVHPEGDSKACKCEIPAGHGPCQTVCRDNKFSAPTGFDSLENFNITKNDLIKGSVRTWKANGQRNGGSLADPREGSTIDDLLKVDITTPGYVRLPVCSPERAFQSWDTSSKGSSPNYPCDIPPGKNNCGDSTFENQTSGGSPSVDDCLQIIKNIEGDGSTEWTVGIGAQKEIAKAGKCRFGVEAEGVKGSVTYKVGGQDMIDIINESIKQFGGGGKVGAKGYMKCNGNASQQPVKWGIY